MNDKQILAKLLMAIEQEKVEVPDSGFFTAKQWSGKWGKGIQWTKKLIGASKKSNKLVVKRFKVLQGKYIRAVDHYKFNI